MNESKAMLELAERCEKASWPDQNGVRGPLASLLTDCAAALRASAPQADVRAALEQCANIALAIDSGRGNEKEIAKAIRALTLPQSKKDSSNDPS